MGYADVIDHASKIADEAVERQVAEIRRAAASAPKLKPIGRCYNCDDAVPDARLFCNKECSDDFELAEAARRRAGRV